MHILTLNPYHAGSHAAFLETWQAHSRHTFTTLTLPGRHWKWRMRHAAITFANQLADDPPRADAIVTTDMLNVAELRALLPHPLRNLPITLYMHENQLTYPNRPRQPHEIERDLHLPLTNLVSTLAADHIWFNSNYHRNAFLDALPDLLSRMPDHAPTHAIDDIARKSSVEYPPVPLAPPPVAHQEHAPKGHATGPSSRLLLFPHRWEHDKNPQTFFHALFQLADAGIPFRIAVLGQQFRNAPPIYETAKARLADHIDSWGYLESRDAYHAVLARADAVISTAHHEFFGIAVLEAVATGALPLTPMALAYPETLSPEGITTSHNPFHDNTPEGLAGRLIDFVSNPPPRHEHERWAAHVAARFSPDVRAAALDDAVQRERAQRI